MQFTYNKQVGIAFIGTIKAIPSKVFGADFISLRRAKKWGSAVAKGYGGTRWGKEPFFKKVFSPQNSLSFTNLPLPEVLPADSGRWQHCHPSVPASGFSGKRAVPAHPEEPLW